MSSNIAFLLSLTFVISMFTFAGDLCCMQTNYAQLDAIAISAGKMISKTWTINEAVVKLVEDNKAHIVTLNTDESHIPGEGDPFRFRVWKEYKPMAFSQETKQLVVNRSVVLGYKG